MPVMVQSIWFIISHRPVALHAIIDWIPYPVSFCFVNRTVLPIVSDPRETSRTPRPPALVHPGPL